MKTEYSNLTSEDGFNADAIAEPIRAALEAARDEARTMTDEQLARALLCLNEHREWQPQAKLIRSMAIAAIEHIRADRIRERLLSHYSTKEPTRFCQVDGWLNGDGITGCDADGHGLTMGATYELMHGSDVRLLIPADPRKGPVELARLVRKIADWVERAGSLDGVCEMRAAHEGPRSGDFTDPDLPF